MSKKKKQNKRTRLDGYLDIFSIGLAIATLFGFLGKLSWFFDLFAHFRVQYMQLGLILIGIALWRRRNKRALALILLACLNYSFVLPLYFGRPEPATENPIRAMLMNIYAGNGNTEQVMKAIKQADPDLLLLEEVTPKWAAEFNQLKDDYPYQLAEPQDGCFGIMLLSKVPLERGKVIENGPARVPTLITEAHFPQGVITVIGTHPVPPAGGSYSRNRNQHLAELPDIIQQQKHPVLLIGDLNTSPWSPYFKQLVTNSGLKNSMKGFGFQPTWPRNNRFLRVPLDHVLHDPEIIIHYRAVGGDVGSDHFPVIVDFSLK